MSVFDEDKISTSPITAQCLRDILEKRTVNSEEDDIVKYDKLLEYIYKRVEYNIDEDIWEHRTCLAAIGVDDPPFEEEYSQQINTLKNFSERAVYDFVKTHPIEPNQKFKKFVNYFKSRGFEIRFRTADYLHAVDKTTAKIINISWKKD